jgi:neutral trehalase
VQTEEDLVSRILAACEAILKRSGVSERVRQEMARRYSVCSEVRTHNIEQLLWNEISTIKIIHKI